jgi:Fe-S cluster assembly iron-binding protein IscA
MNMEQTMKELDADESSAGGKMLRLSVETGGCSGFSYAFDLDDRVNSDDRYYLLDSRISMMIDLPYTGIEHAKPMSFINYNLLT